MILILKNTLGTNENYIYSIIVLKNLVPAMDGGVRELPSVVSPTELASSVYTELSTRGGFFQGVLTKFCGDQIPTDVPSKEASVAEMFINSHGRQGRPDKQRPTRPSKDRRTDNKVSQGTKVHRGV